MNTQRQYSPFATPTIKQHLQGLLDTTNNPTAYQKHMYRLGELLCMSILTQLKHEVLVVSTAEDADYLQAGVQSELEKAHINYKLAIFWNNHYQLQNGKSVAPIVHKYIEPNYNTAKTMIIVKSIMSGSCVVRTNLLELLETAKTVEKIYILSPVMYKNAEYSLKAEFPTSIADKFEFIYFAMDTMRDEHTGEVIPGIGGQVYQLLGLQNQPVFIGYIPKVVETRLAL